MMTSSGHLYRRFGLYFLAASLVVGARPAHAAMVTWGPETDIFGESDVSLNGSLVGAFNLGGQTTTVNGVMFQQFIIGTPQVVSATVGFATLSFTPPNAGHTLTNFDTSSALAPFSALSPSYRSLLGSAAGRNFGDNTTTLTIAGLTIGTSYEFQAWVNDSSITRCCSFGVSLGPIDPDGDVIAEIDLNPNTKEGQDPMTGDKVVLEGGLGRHVIGTFVADANSQVLGFERGEIGGGLNAIQLRDVSAPAVIPEPSTLSLLALGLAGLAYRARRSRT